MCVKYTDQCSLYKERNNWSFKVVSGIITGKIGWGGRGVKMIGKKQNSKNAKGDLLANGWGTLQSGGSAPPKQGFLFIFVVHRSYVGGGLYSSVH